MPTTIYNQAELNYNNNIIRSNTVSAEIVETLEATKTAVNQNYANGDRITYVINLKNSGGAFTNLTLSDNLGEYSPASIAPQTVTPLTYVPGSVVFFANGSFVSRPTITSTEPLRITGLNVPAFGSATLVYEADVNTFAPLDADGEINNSVTITGSGLTEPVTATAQITTDDEPRLSIIKSITPQSIQENGRINYFFTIENRGNSAAETTVFISDTFNPVLSDISVMYEGQALVSPTDYTYDSATGLFETTPGTITVPAATFTEDARTGETIITPGRVLLSVSGTV